MSSKNAWPKNTGIPKYKKQKSHRDRKKEAKIKNENRRKVHILREELKQIGKVFLGKLDLSSENLAKYQKVKKKTIDELKKSKAFLSHLYQEAS